MAKDLIIGAFSNYNDYNVLKPWVQSIRDTDFDGDIVLIAIEADPLLVGELIANGVKVVAVKKQNDMMIHMLRFIYIYDFLKKYGSEYRNVITTDVRDVIFQENPFPKLETLMSEFLNERAVVAQSEAILIKDENWNRQNIIKNFGEYFYNDVKDNPVCNVGLLAGSVEHIKDLCFHLYQMSLNRPDWVADQAAYNMLLSYEPWKSVTKVVGLSEAWAINAHVTNKPDQLDEFGPYLLEDRPYFEDGIVRNSDGKPFVIVHQYDRVPEWNEYILNKYNAKITKETNTGTSPKYFNYTT